MLSHVEKERRKNIFLFTFQEKKNNNKTKGRGTFFWLRYRLRPRPLERKKSRGNATTTATVATSSNTFLVCYFSVKDKNQSRRQLQLEQTPPTSKRNSKRFQSTRRIPLDHCCPFSRPLHRHIMTRCTHLMAFTRKAF